MDESVALVLAILALMIIWAIWVARRETSLPEEPPRCRECGRLYSDDEE